MFLRFGTSVDIGRVFPGAKFPIHDFWHLANVGSIDLADADRDGAIDFVAAGPLVAVVRFGDGLGGFPEEARIEVPGSGQHCVFGDIDGDGVLDVVAHIGNGRLGVARGLGDRRFDGMRLFPVGAADVIATCDLNGDGFDDVVAFGPNIDTVSVLLADGGGGLQGASSFAVGDFPLRIAIGDLDDDGYPDLVIANGGESFVSLLFGDGSGRFPQRVDVPAGIGPRGLAIGDFDGDGCADLAIASFGDGLVTILSGDGRRGFVLANQLPTGLSPASVAVGDLDADGATDLAVAGGFGWSTWRGDGAGGFEPIQTSAVHTNATGIALGDANHDGRLDVFVANTVIGDVSVLLGERESAGRMQVPLQIDEANPSRAVELVDLNGDGALDLVSTDNATGLAVRLGDGAGNFGTATRYSTTRPPGRVEIGDMDGDGELDVVMSSPAPLSGVTVFYGDGTGGFDDRVEIDNIRVAEFVLVDVDGDARLDILGIGFNSYSVILAHPRGGFGPYFTVGLPIRPRSIAVDDINHDGWPDVAFGGERPGDAILVRLGDGTSTLVPHLSIPFAFYPATIAFADMNADGNPDLLVGQEIEPGLSVLFGDGLGGFGPASVYETRAVRTLKAADLDDDGELDVMMVCGSCGDLAVMFGGQTGARTLVQRFGVGDMSSPTTVRAAIGDVNGDGALDVAVTTRRGISILFNQR